MQTLHDLFIGQLNELFAGEAASIQAMQALRRAASNPRLAKLLEAHERESEKHAARLEDIFDSLEVVPRRAGSHTLKGLCDDCVEWASMSGAEPHVRDAALIAAAQHLEHDEIAGYGCARTWASLLGFTTSASEMLKTLTEERRFDESLTRIAETLNKSALEPMAVAR
jgi:ferritin-like metal-binding protein YciE